MNLRPPVLRTETWLQTPSPEVFTMFGILLVLAAGISGYLMARKFVHRRLRFVDAVQSPFAPVVAGIVAAALTVPLTLLSFVPGATAVAFGMGTALGTSSAPRAIRRSDGELRRLTP
jgi:hypothetical protein